MTKIFFAILSLSAAAMLEWGLVGFSFFGIPPPLIVAVLILWFWALPFYYSLGLAVLAGVALDSISILSFGSHVVSFLLLIFAVELLRYFFANTKSLLAQWIGETLLFFLYFVSLYLIAFFLRGLTESRIGVAVISPAFLFLGAAVFWSVFLPTLMALGRLYFYKKRGLT